MLKAEWTEDAIKDLESLDVHVVRRILRKVTWFCNNVASVTPEQLSGDLPGTFKLRIGDWRVIYSLEEEIMVIHAVGHRREIYRL